MWVQSPRPRRATTLLVTAGFSSSRGYSIRNIVFVGPVLALQVAWTAPNRSPGPMRMPVAIAGSAAAAATLVWAAILGPPRDDRASASRSRTTRSPIHRSTGGSSPMRAWAPTSTGARPDTPRRAERLARALHAEELRDNYGVLRDGSPDLRGALRRLKAGR